MSQDGQSMAGPHRHSDTMGVLFLFYLALSMKKGSDIT